MSLEFDDQQLPDWMQRARRKTDWGVLLVVGFALALAMPFLLHPDLPHTNASENYVYLTADYAQALEEGRLYPRWSANVLGGYGAPVPHFYPPLPAYGSALVKVLLTDDSVAAIRIMYVIALVGASVAVYCWVLRRASAPAGVLAALLYICSPYMGLTSPHVMGDLPGSLTLGLVPTLLWASDRLLRRNQPTDIILVAVTTAALILTRPEGLIIGALFIIGLAVWEHHVAGQRVNGWALLCSLVLGIGMSTFFWLPAVLEANSVTWQFVTHPPEWDIRLGDLFATLRPLDLAQTVYIPQFTTGLGLPLLAACGALLSSYIYRKMTLQSLFFLAGWVIAIWLIMVRPDDVALVGFLTLCWAISASGIVVASSRFLSKQLERLLLTLLIILTWIAATPIWSHRPAKEPFGETDAGVQVAYDQRGYGVAILPPGHPLPITVPTRLLPSRYLLDNYAVGSVNKLAPGQITSSFQAGLLDHNSHSDTFQVSFIRPPLTLDVLTAYFPGWRATLDDEELSLQQNPVNGLIQIQIDEISRSRGEMTIYLGTTNIRQGAWLVTAATLAILLLWTRRRFQHPRRLQQPERKLLTTPEARLIVMPLLTFTVVNILLRVPGLPFSLEAVPGYSLRDALQINNRTDGGLTLLGFDPNTRAFRPGEVVHLNLYWQAQRFLTENYLTQITLVNNRDGQAWVVSQPRPPGLYPTRRWNTVQYVVDPYQLILPADIPVGNYQIRVSAFWCSTDCETGRNNLNFFDTSGELIGTSVNLPTLLAVNADR